MDVLHTLSVGAAAVAIVGIIAWAANSCSLQETALREACIRGGGTVIVVSGANGDSHCIRGFSAAGER